MNLKMVILNLVLVCVAFTARAEGNVLEEYFFESGKIKVVIAVAVIVLAGLFVYLFRLDMKLRRLEDKHKK